MRIGIDLGGSHIAIGIIDEKGKIIEKVEKDFTKEEKLKIYLFIENDLEKIIKKYIEKYSIDFIGIAIPGIITENKVNCPNLNLKQYPIIEVIEEKLQIPVKIDNDANCIALAEKKYGIAKESNDIFFFTVGTGIGGAYIKEGKLLRPIQSTGIEVGHMIIQKDGILCGCGKKGCFEQYASMRKFKQDIIQVLNLKENLDGKEILQELNKNITDVKVQEVINQYIEYLSIGISNVINTLEPEVICIGGSFVYFQDILLQKLKDKLLNSNLLLRKRKELQIKCAVLENQAGMIGSTLLDE